MERPTCLSLRTGTVKHWAKQKVAKVKKKYRY
jgi:hypothetical protein